MNNHGIHTITFIFNLALTLHTVRRENLSLAFVVLALLHIAASHRSFEAHEKFSLFLLPNFFFTLQRKLLIICNVITLRSWEMVERITIARWERKQSIRRRNIRLEICFFFMLSVAVCCDIESEKNTRKQISSFFFFLS